MNPGYGYLIGKSKSFATVTGKSSNIIVVNLKKYHTIISIVVLIWDTDYNCAVDQLS